MPRHMLMVAAVQSRDVQLFKILIFFVWRCPLTLKLLAEQNSGAQAKQIIDRGGKIKTSVKS